MSDLPPLKRLPDFLQTAPLYEWGEFATTSDEPVSLPVAQVDVYCDVCKKHRPFQDSESRGGGAKMPRSYTPTNNRMLRFICVTCRMQSKIYCVYIKQGEGKVSIQKFGEQPRPPLDRDKNLQKFLYEDLELYEKAVVCISHGYGIGAFAYFRRILERNIAKLLEDIESDVMSDDANRENVEVLKELKAGSSMSDKIALARKAVPAYLQLDGENPLGRLYEILSQGLHQMDDAECLNKAKTAEACLRFLTGELTDRRKRREQFRNNLQNL